MAHLPASLVLPGFGWCSLSVIGQDWFSGSTLEKSSGLEGQNSQPAIGPGTRSCQVAAYIFAAPLQESFAGNKICRQQETQTR